MEYPSVDGCCVGGRWSNAGGACLAVCVWRSTTAHREDMPYAPLPAVEWVGVEVVVPWFCIGGMAG